MNFQLQTGTSEHRSAFGRSIVSDFPLDRLPLTSERGPADVEICSSGRTWLNVEIPDSTTHRFSRDPHEGGIRFVADRVGEFLVRPSGKSIVYSLAPGARVGDVQHILTGPVLVMALQLQGQFFLHAGAVERHGGMLVLAAPHGFGKSTLTAAFQAAGCVVHSDDVVPLRENEGDFVAGQGQPWLKLWDDALAEFGRDADAFDQVIHGLAKRVVPGIDGEGDIPLNCVYLLAPHANQQRPIEFHQLSSLDGALALMSNVYSPEIVIGELAARTLDFATRVAEQVPVRAIAYCRSFENLPAIRDAILKDFQGITHA